MGTLSPDHGPSEEDLIFLANCPSLRGVVAGGLTAVGLLPPVIFPVWLG